MSTGNVFIDVEKFKVHIDDVVMENKRRLLKYPPVGMEARGRKTLRDTNLLRGIEIVDKVKFFWD